MSFFLSRFLFVALADVDVIDSDSDDDEPTVYVAGKAMPLSEVEGNSELIAQMTPQEKETYIQVHQDTYSHMYD